MSSPLINKGIVYAGMTDNSTYVFDAATGSYKWQYKTKGPVASSPAADGNSLFFGSDDKKLYALDIAGSQPVSLWNFTANGAIRSTPAVYDGRVSFGSDNHTLYTLNETTGKLIWSWTATDTSAKLRNGVAVADDIVYLTFDKSSKVYALHADVVPGNYTESGISAIRYWTKDFSADYGVSGFNEPVYANGKIVVTSTGGSPAVIYALGASSGNTLWKRIVNWWPAIGNPCVADGRVWFSAYWWDAGSFTLYCLGQPFPPTTYHYKVSAGGTSFDVTLVTNSTVASLNTTVLETKRAIGFGVPGIGTTGMCNITVPNSMLGGPYVVTVDGKAPWTYSTTVINATHTALYFTYNASSKVAQIIGATAVPEFPVPIAILVWGLLTLTVVSIRKRRLIP